MFDPDGGFENVLKALINIFVIIMIIVLSVDRDNKLYSAIFFFICTAIYGFVLYVAIPSLTFWKV